MRQLYLDCGMGAAGDMLTAALLELFADPDAIVAELNALGIPGVTYTRESSVKCGITGTHMKVTVNGEEEELFHHHHLGQEHHHHHSGMDEILHLIAHLNVSDSVGQNIRAVYTLIAEAESHAHGMPVEQIHFHEVGTMDAVADVAAVCYLMEKLQADRVTASPIHVGSGQVYCAHGILPVPAPATAYILRGVPIYGGAINGELCTPTGAALLKHFVSDFGAMPVMTVDSIGYGMGKKDFAVANCVRAMLGSDCGGRDTVLELCCNLDDMTGEDIGFAMERLLSEGALDVYTTAIGMKKNRPGVMLTVLCRPVLRDRMVKTMFACTTTLGIRESSHSRYVLSRREETVDTEFGPVRQKVSEGYGVIRRKPEYDDLCRLAEEKNIPISRVRNAWEKQRKGE